MKISRLSLPLCLVAAALLPGRANCAPGARLSTAGSPPVAAASSPPALYLGTAWYPEQWPESRWNADLDLMEAAHIRFVRIGEFAWSR
ncbi:MAG: beta-galactosidase, partial [Acidobacteriota bacterium]